jgi:hypothetical protein
LGNIVAYHTSLAAYGNSAALSLRFEWFSFPKNGFLCLLFFPEKSQETFSGSKKNPKSSKNKRPGYFQNILWPH